LDARRSSLADNFPLFLFDAAKEETALRSPLPSQNGRFLFSLIDHGSFASRFVFPSVPRGNSTIFKQFLQALPLLFPDRAAIGTVAVFLQKNTKFLCSGRKGVGSLFSLLRNRDRSRACIINVLSFCGPRSPSSVITVHNRPLFFFFFFFPFSTA